ncbi:helix-turn-helix domain-containing protein [Aquimarina agarilytica]|uniref:helix-turn-helix domain-containing protein n=1 Tax=Aquimarina agarilytica TaxID=1087449 RepID=UPI000288F59A|nr:helix-turn-helix domain-containing protein [Aquimarina agarilytica]
MIYSFNEPHTNAKLTVGDHQLLEKYATEKKLEAFTFIRATKDLLKLSIDGIQVSVEPDKIISLTPNQHLSCINHTDQVIMYQFNREFYCIKDHDKEVNCMGVLFFSHNVNPIFSLGAEEISKFNSLHNDIIDEISTADSIQAEMLRILIKNFIIRSTRLLKSQQTASNESAPKQDLLRQFNILVEEHFKTEHQVSFYADKLFKSPKTLSNNFNQLKTSPLQIIQQRIILETKRLINYSDQSFKEIAFHLGYNDASQLSKLFKKSVGVSPRAFKKEAIGKN